MVKRRSSMFEVVPTTARSRVTAIATIATCALVLFPRSSTADAVTDWNANAGKAARAACLSPALDPLHESRAYAMMHIAIHDALNAIDRRFRPYAFRARAEAGPLASAEAAVAAAARGVLV